MRYESWKGLVERDLEPLGLALKAGIWYLVARAGAKPRTYRISNIQKLDVIGDAFTRPLRFDLAAYWSEWSKDFEARLYKATATLRLSPTGVKRLSLLPPAISEMAARTMDKPNRAGWVRVQIPIESLAHAAGEILRLGPHAEVLKPPELRTRMRELTAEIGALYRR